MASRRLQFSVFSHAFREARRPALIWSAVMAAAVLLLLLAHPLLRTALAGPLPGWAALLLGVPAVDSGLENQRAWWLTAAFNLVLPVLMILYSVRLGSVLMAREEERGSLGFLLSTPLPRSLLVLEMFAALLVLLLIPTMAVWLACTLTGYFDPRLALGLFLLGLTFGAPAFALGAVTGRQMISQNIVLAVALLTFLLDRLAKNSPAEAVLRLFSPFSYYGTILGGGLAAPVLVLLGLSLLAFVLGGMIFNHRDLQI